MYLCIFGIYFCYSFLFHLAFIYVLCFCFVKYEKEKKEIDKNEKKGKRMKNTKILSFWSCIAARSSLQVEGGPGRKV